MKLVCTKNLDGFTLGKKYKVLGCIAEYVQLKDDNKEIVIVNEIYFNPVK